MTRVELEAPAKVNLRLAVTGRRDDGYHLLDSLVVFADLSDTVTLGKAETSSVVETGRFAPSLSKPGSSLNIIELAIDAFDARTGNTASYAAEVVKNIPVAAGLGGGSADAAATLVMLNRINGYPLSAGELDQAGLAIGADVPACLRSHGAGAGTGSAWRMRGAGERLDRVEIPENLGLLLVNCGRAVSTASVFGAMEAQAANDGLESVPGTPDGSLGMDALKEQIALGNHLLAPAVDVCPEIAGTLEEIGRVSESGGFIGGGMSGSGATCFAVFETRPHAERAAKLFDAGRFWCWAGGLHGGSRLPS